MRGARILAALLALALPAGGQLDADFKASPLSGTNPLTVDFTDLTTPDTPSSWLWQFGDGGNASVPNPSHTYTTPGTYDVTLTVFDGPFVFDMETKTALITVDAAPLVPDFTATPTSGTNPLPVDFTDTSTGATVTAWSWDFGDGQTSTGANPTHIYGTPGLHSVSLTVFVGGQGETVSKTDLIDVAPAPLVPAFSAAPTTGVNPLTVRFTDETTGTPPTAWLWDFGDGASSTEQHPSHTYAGDTSYSVSLTAFVGAQSATVAEPDLITVDPAPLVAAFTTDTFIGQLPLTVTFTDTSTGAEPTGWTWFPSSGGTGIEAGPEYTHIYTAPGTFSVTLGASLGTQHEFVTSPDLVTVLPLPKATESLGLSAGRSITSDRFGESVACSGSRILSGAPNAFSFPGVQGGAAYLHDAATGALVLKLIQPTAGTDAFGTAVALDGDLALVGAPQDDDLAPDSGAAYLIDAATGAVLSKLLSPGGDLNDEFGSSVALDGDLALVGAPLDTVAGTEGAGSATLFDVSDPTLPVVLAQLTSNESFWPQHFGTAVALDGSRALVSAPLRNVDGEQMAGRATLYDISSPSQPTVVAQLKDSDPAYNARFGTDVALADGYVVVGVPGGTASSAVEAAQVFDGDDGTWLATLQAPDSSLGAQFGSGVAVSGSLAVVGAPGFENSPGVAYLFELPSGAFRARLEWSGAQGADDLGWAAALEGDRAVIGAPGTATSGSPFSGSTFLFDVALGSWSDLGQALPASTGAPALVGSGPLTPGADLVLGLTGGAPWSAAFLVVGFSELSAPFKSGVLVPAPDVVVGTLPLDAAGDLWIPDTLPEGLPPAATLLFQSWILDATGPSGFSASNAVKARMP